MTTPSPTNYTPTEPDSLLDILTRFPAARVTVTFSNRASKPRAKPRVGDRKFIKKRGGWCVRMHEKYDGCYLRRNGRYAYVWVPESHLSAYDRESLRLQALGRGEVELAKHYAKSA